MSESRNTENAGLPIQVAISIPGNASDAGHGVGCGATIRELMTAAGVKATAHPQTVAILDVVPGLDPVALRPGFVVASPRQEAVIVPSDFTTHGRPVAAGDSWYDPARKSIDLYVRSLTAAPVSALAVLYP